MRERWKDIEGYEGFYQISSLGNVKTFTLRHYGKVMKLEVDRKGYYVVRLVKFGVPKKIAIHRTVFHHFNESIGPNDVIHHIDENKLNNCVNNLMKTTIGEHRAMHNIGVKPIYVTNF
jgi:hypothetical protein